MQGVDTIVCLVCTLHLAPGIEELVWCEQRTIFVIHAIADNNKSIIAEQLRNIPAIAHRQLCVCIHDGGIFLHGTLELQNHNGQTIHIDDAIGDTSFQSLYLQLVDDLEDIAVNILKVYHFNEQVRQRGILTLDGEALRHHAIRLCVLLVKRSTIVCSQLRHDTLHLHGRNAFLGISVHQIHPQVITQQHFRLLLVYRLAIHVAVALLLKQFHDGHLQCMFVKV